MAFYELLAAEGLPLLVHTGNEHTCRPGRNAWNDPALLRHALERGVTVIAARIRGAPHVPPRCLLLRDLLPHGVLLRAAIWQKRQPQPGCESLATVVVGLKLIFCVAGISASRHH